MDTYELEHRLAGAPISEEHRTRLAETANTIETKIIHPERRNRAIDAVILVAVGDTELEELADAWRAAKTAEQSAMDALCGAMILASTQDQPEHTAGARIGVPDSAVQAALTEPLL